MPDNTKKVKSLNRLLQGEYMAVEGFNTFISRAKDENVKKTFQEVQKQHRKNIEKLAGYIQDIGGRPHENLGRKGKMADMKVNIDLGLRGDTDEIIKSGGG